MTDRTADVAVQVRQLFDAKAAARPSKYTPDGRLAGRLTRLAGSVTYHVPAGGSVLDLEVPHLSDLAERSPLRLLIFLRPGR